MGNIAQQTGALSLETATKTSGKIEVAFAESIIVQFIAASISSGNGVFTVDASNDGTNWITGIAFQDATSTAPTTWVTSKTLSSNTSAAGIVPSGYKFIRVKVTVTTDGSYSALVNQRGQ